MMPTAAITFLSKVYSGCISDAHIMEKSGFLDKLSERDDVMADRGFNICHLLLPKQFLAICSPDLHCDEVCDSPSPI